MASRLLGQINADIAKCRDPVENTCLRAEKAALLARQGQLDEARRELASIHARYDSRPNAVVSAWVSLAEGLVAFYENFGVSAHDKMLRALALSSAVQNQKVRLLSSAWLAHLDYLNQRFETMVRHLNVVLAEAPSDADSARARAYLVVAQAFHWADRFDLAKPWYGKAHQHATREGDQTTISALMHNMAWLRMAQARRMAVATEVDKRQLQEVLLGAESTYYFDLNIGTASLRSLVPVLRAHILSLLDRYAEALALFDAHLSAALADGLERLQCGMLAEIAWCRANLGDHVGAQVAARDAQSHVLDCEEADERAAAHGRLAQVFGVLCNTTEAERHAALAALDWQTHTERQLHVVANLSHALATAGRT